MHTRHNVNWSSHVSLNRNRILDQKTNSDPEQTNISSSAVSILEPHASLEQELSWMLYDPALHLLLKSGRGSASDSLKLMTMKCAALWPWGSCSWWFLLLLKDKLSVPSLQLRASYLAAPLLNPQICLSGKSQYWISEGNRRFTSVLRVVIRSCNAVGVVLKHEHFIHMDLQMLADKMTLKLISNLWKYFK